MGPSRLRLNFSASPSTIAATVFRTMLLRLPVAAHCFLGPARRCYSSAPASIAVDPLRILFCGSDHFSIASLRALVDAKHDLPTLIESIHVAHRPAKPTGRGLKKLTDGTYARPPALAPADCRQFPSSR